MSDVEPLFAMLNALDRGQDAARRGDDDALWVHYGRSVAAGHEMLAGVRADADAIRADIGDDTDDLIACIAATVATEADRYALGRVVAPAVSTMFEARRRDNVARLVAVIASIRKHAVASPAVVAFVRQVAAVFGVVVPEDGLA